MRAPVLERREHWECPNCTLTDVTVNAPPGPVFHHCAGLRGLTAPMIRAGTRAKVVANERDDYVGSDIVTLDGDGRPVMNVETTRDDGTDLVVFAPCATLKGQA